MPPTRFPKPTATAWLYMMDGPGPWDTIPAEWSNIKFGAIDVLVLASLGLQDSHTRSFGTIVPTIPAIYATVRAQLDGLSHAKGGRHYYTTVSPANLQYLQDAVGHISGVNMQTYSGGQGLTVKDFLGVGFGVDQLLYGVNSETPSELGPDGESGGWRVQRLQAGGYP